MEIEKIPVLDSDLLDFAEYDNYWGAVKEKKSPSGITVVIEVGRSLGLSSYFLFVTGD